MHHRKTDYCHHQELLRSKEPFRQLTKGNPNNLKASPDSLQDLAYNLFVIARYFLKKLTAKLGGIGRVGTTPVWRAEPNNKHLAFFVKDGSGLLLPEFPPSFLLYARELNRTEREKFLDFFHVVTIDYDPVDSSEQSSSERYRLLIS